MNTVLIQGGTFDPIHNAHLRTALDVAALLAVEQIRLIPCGDPAHRDCPGATAEQRVQMLQSAVQDQPQFVIDAQELQRGGPSYMVDTAKSLRQELGDEVSICLMMGMDAFLGLHQWHQWQQITDYLNLIVVARPHWQDEEKNMHARLQDLLQQRQVATVAELLAVPTGKILMVTVSQLAISATKIREIVKCGESPKGLLPEVVIQQINDQQLYRN